MSQFVMESQSALTERESLDEKSLSSLYDELDSFIQDLDVPPVTHSSNVPGQESSESLDSGSSVEIQTVMVGHKYQLSPSIKAAQSSTTDAVVTAPASHINRRTSSLLRSSSHLRTASPTPPPKDAPPFPPARSPPLGSPALLAAALPTMTSPPMAPAALRSPLGSPALSSATPPAMSPSMPAALRSPPAFGSPTIHHAPLPTRTASTPYTAAPLPTRTTSAPYTPPSANAFSVHRSTSLGSNAIQPQQQPPLPRTGNLPQRSLTSVVAAASAASPLPAPAVIPRTSSLAKDTIQRSGSLASYRSHPAGSLSSLSLQPSHAVPAGLMSPPMPSSLVKIDETQSLHFANHALLSELVTMFIDQVHLVTSRRKIFTTAEYPTSFNGEEAVDITRSILPESLPESMYLKVTRALMHTSPPVIIPITYSEKSTRRNTLYQSSHEVYRLIEGNIPQGVYTPLTQCYSLSCLRGQGACYAPCCPNRLTSDLTAQNGVERRSSFSSSVASSHDTTLSRAWSATVSKEILQTTPHKEIARQEAIHELIYTEEDYVRDLNLLDELFAKALREAQCIEIERRESFCDYIFSNYLELMAIHRDLYRELRDYQCLCQANTVGGFVDRIGDIFLRHIVRFMQAYKRYGPHVVLAEYAVKKEMATNMLFQNFIHEKEKQPETRKLPFRHFIILPVTRLQRYPLLIGAILKKTPEDHPDYEILEECLEILKRVATTMDQDTVNTKAVLRVQQVNDAIRSKPTEAVDLQLTVPGRRILHEGPLTRRGHMVGDSSEIYVFLFDHMLVMTRRRRVGTAPAHQQQAGYNEDEYEYHISKRPIPLMLLLLEEATEGFSLGIRTMSSNHSTTLTSRAGTLVNLNSYGSAQPLLLHHLGRMGGDHLLFADSPATRLAWKESIVQAKALLEEKDAAHQAFKVMSLSDATFRTNYQFGRVTCSVQFEGTKGIRMIAVGTVAGVWMGIEGDTNSIRQVLAIEDVTQMAVLPGPHILAVLADKTLYSYALEALDPTAKKVSKEKPFQRVAQHISYFNAGVCNGRTLVIAMKKRGLDSHFKAFEPVCGDLRDPANNRFLTTKTGLFGKSHAWFRVHKEFYVGADSSAVHFLKARVVVVCPRGFEVIDLDNLHLNRNIPDLSQPDFAFVHQRADVFPLGFFKCRQYYLLCYNAFAFLVDTHGNFIQENYAWIAWEGTPQAIAFYYPYIIAFDNAFIEIRHVETGELIQIIAGVQMRCLQFTNDTFAPVVHGCMTHPFKPDFQYVFQLMANFEPVTLYPNSPMPQHRQY